MKEQLEKIKQEALAALAVTKESVDLEALRVKYLGKKENSPLCSSKWESSARKSALSLVSWPMKCGKD